MSESVLDQAGGDCVGGRCVDVSGSSRIKSTLQTVRDLSRAQDPRQVLDIFGQWRRQERKGEAYVSLSTRDLDRGRYKVTRVMEFDRLGNEPAMDDPWRNWDKLPVHAGGVLGQIVREGRPQIVHDLDLSSDPVLGGVLDGYHSLMAMPLFDDGKAQNWAIPLRKEPQGFTIEELEESLMRGNLVGMTIKRTLVTQQLSMAKEALDAEIKKIGAIQKSLLPRPLPDVPGLSMAAFYTTSDQAGGDLYDVLRATGSGGESKESSGRWAILVADASGHGPAAATMSAMMHAFLRAYTGLPLGPGEVLTRVNGHLCRRNTESSFVTAFLGIYDTATRTLSYSNAGHPPPLLRRSAGTERLTEGASLPLGILEDARYEQAQCGLGDLETLLLYTDGVTEARDAVGEMFGIEGIEHALGRCDGETGCAVSSIGEALHKHQGGRQGRDDQTLLALRVMVSGVGP